jgi:ADP-L-glycero-D-manno-heptose 6-epimerase
MKVLITGGTGFVGRRIARRLIKDGHEVTVTSGGHLPVPKGVKEVYYRGLGEIESRYLNDIEVLVHQLAINDTRCMDQKQMNRVNVLESRDLFVRVLNESDCRNFVYASSTAVYGHEAAPYDEAITDVYPANPYGESKAKFDEWAMEFASDHSVKMTGLRYCNVYGPGEDHKGTRMSMVGQILRKMLAGYSPRLFKPGDQKRDWIFVDDVVDMNVLAINRQAGRNGEIYNCGSGVAYSFNEIVQIINEFNGSQIEPEYIPCPFEAEYQSFTQCGIDKARRELGFSPRFDLRSGIIEYLKELSVGSS